MKKKKKLASNYSSQSLYDYLVEKYVNKYCK